MLYRDNDSLLGKIVEDATRWVLSVDRRLVVMRALEASEAFSASEIAERTGRSVQNISRAIDELEGKGLIECLTPQKQTWKRYLLTGTGKTVIDDLRDRKMVP
jgi:predicted transcriptional regulator